ncbi:zinc-dependent alcohol dehydrogenase family protein [Ectothiorhodospiraceae bacterium WFHF3C12]|nr:zinc-dependent alcohol dehydrogenase family protein [Ectothiorhodospiraceae bacterium WFHF3C12]
MRAMVFHGAGRRLALETVPVPAPSDDQVLIKVEACAVCRTDLHVVDSDLTEPKLPLIPGHEVVGRVSAVGGKVAGFSEGDRIGVPWLGYTCGECRYCRAGQENLCERAGFTGYTLDGGYAEYMVADSRFCFPIPERYDSVEAAPLLCAGLIGYRSYRMAGEHAEHLGLYGFGAAAHILAQLAAHQGRRIYAFTRPGDTEGQAFARRLGAEWTGGSEQTPPVSLDAAVIFAPVGALVPAALAAVRPGGVVVCGGIHMSDIPTFPYSLLWRERVLRSVANLTRRDGEEFMALAARAPLRVETRRFDLEQANEALDALRAGALEGAAVLTP